MSITIPQDHNIHQLKKPGQIIYVLVYPSRLFAAHWSLWIPQLDINGEERHTGDRIHVTGDRLNGFAYDYDRGYNIQDDDRHPNVFPLGLVSAEHLSADDAASDADSLNPSPVNALDAACRIVPAPGPNLNRVTPADNGARALGRLRTAEVKDCQWWIEKVSMHLVSEGFLVALDGDDHAGAIYSKVKELPRH